MPGKQRLEKIADRGRQFFHVLPERTEKATDRCPRRFNRRLGRPLEDRPKALPGLCRRAVNRSPQLGNKTADRRPTRLQRLKRFPVEQALERCKRRLRRPLHRLPDTFEESRYRLPVSHYQTRCQGNHCGDNANGGSQQTHHSNEPHGPCSDHREGHGCRRQPFDQCRVIGDKFANGSDQRHQAGDHTVDRRQQRLPHFQGNTVYRIVELLEVGSGMTERHLRRFQRRGFTGFVLEFIFCLDCLFDAADEGFQQPAPIDEGARIERAEAAVLDAFLERADPGLDALELGIQLLGIDHDHGHVHRGLNVRQAHALLYVRHHCTCCIALIRCACSSDSRSTSSGLAIICSGSTFQNQARS